MSDNGKERENLRSLIDPAGEVEELQKKYIDRLKKIDDAYTPAASKYFAWLERTGYGFLLDLGEYLKYLRETYRAARTISLYVAAAKHRIRLVLPFVPANQRLQIKDYLSDIRADKSERSIDESKILSAEEIDRLLEGLESGSSRVPGAETISLAIRFLAATGIRVSELINCRLVDIIETGPKLRVRIHGKGRKERLIAVVGGNDVLSRIKHHFQGTTWLFEHGGKQFDRRYLTQGIARAGQNILNRDGVSAHTLRHSTATQMVRKGIAIKKVSRYLGHASTAITLDMYVHQTMGDGDLIGLWDSEDNDDL